MSSHLTHFVDMAMKRIARDIEAKGAADIRGAITIAIQGAMADAYNRGMVMGQQKTRQ